MKSEAKILIEQFESAKIFPVVSRISADLITPFAAYLKLADGATQSFLFESVEGGESLARYSFLGSNPEFVVRDDVTQTIIERNGEQEIKTIRLMDFLKRELQPRAIAECGELPSFIGGAIGHFDFEMVAEFEPSFRFESGPGPRAEFAFYTNTLAFDHARQQILITNLILKSDDESLDQFSSRIEHAFLENDKIEQKLREPLPSKKPSQRSQSSKLVETNANETEFIAAVNRVKENILAGECYQAVISRKFLRKTDASPESIYRALRSINPSPYMFLIDRKTEVLIGASPEMLVRARGKRLSYRPIAGTAPRGANDEEDEQFAKVMRSSQKECAEHVMLVDLGRNDLGRVSEFGSVEVRELMAVEKFSHVQHLVSYLYSDLGDSYDRFDALASCFPAGTVTGAPKIRAIEIIREIETSPRGLYSGAVGYIDYANNLDMCIAIRTLSLHDGVAEIQAGAGIVFDSDPVHEFQETQHKANGLLRAIELAEGGKYDV